MNKREKELRAIAWMVQYHIGSEDWYSDYENIKEYSYFVTYDDEFEDIVAYLLYDEHGEYFRGVRSGVRRSHRGQGMAVKLYKRLRAKARRAGKEYKTYSSANNIASINAHLKAGMHIEKIMLMEGDFISVHLTTGAVK